MALGWVAVGWFAVTCGVLLAALAFLSGGDHPWLLVMLAIALLLIAVGRLLLAGGN